MSIEPRPPAPTVSRSQDVALAAWAAGAFLGSAVAGSLTAAWLGFLVGFIVQIVTASVVTGLAWGHLR